MKKINEIELVNLIKSCPLGLNGYAHDKLSFAEFDFEESDLFLHVVRKKDLKPFKIPMSNIGLIVYKIVK